MNTRVKIRYFLEDHLPFRLQWISKLVVVEPRHWPKILSALDYSSMFRRDKETANINNEIVGGLILRLYGPNILKVVLEAGDALGMRLFLTYGTLLGHLRDKGFIPHDWDIDIGVLEADLSKMKLLMRAVEQKGYPVARESRHRMAFRDPMNLIHLDIDYFFPQGDTFIHHVFNVGWAELYTYSYPARMLSDFVTVQFLGSIPALIPVDAEGFLAEVYGDWRTPRKGLGATDFPNAVITKVDPASAAEYMSFPLPK